MRTQSTTDSDTMSFRAASLDEAVALAEESLGAPVRVVAANRIRRGGIGGFFAADLGVEVSVSLDDETIEQALERLVSETAADERTRWMEHRDRDEAVVPAAPRRSGLATPKPSASLGLPAPAPSTVRVAQREIAPSMVPVEQILDELAYLTTKPAPAAIDPVREAIAPLAVPTPITVPRVVALPTLPPRPGEVALAASTNAAASQAHAVAEQRELAAAHLAAAIDAVPFLPTLPEKPTAKTVASAAGGQIAEVEVEMLTDDAPSQRHVELAVAAADQLIESMQRDAAVKRMSVRVVLRSGDQRTVEAVAEWEA